VRGPRGAADAQKYLNIIHGSGKHLLELINDILDLSKVEAGHLEVERLPCEVHQVVLDVAKIMAVKAEEKGIGLRVCFDGRLPDQASTDPHRLRQVITNLVGNAIKFTAKGEVRISLRMDPAPGSTLMQIDVADSGIGIPSDRLESIFEPFDAGRGLHDPQLRRHRPGPDHQPALRARARRQRVRHERAGQGSIFHVSIDAGPLERRGLAVREELEARRERVQRAAGEQVTWVFPRRLVLVVDDGRENRELLRVVLGGAGLEMVEAENGAIGLERAAEHDPDLILMDIQMPVMDGITATKTLRQRGFVKPVIALTANAMKGFEREIEEGGFTAHVTKPIDIDALLARLAKLLGGRKLEGRGDRGSAGDGAARAGCPRLPRLSAHGPLPAPRGAPITSRPGESPAPGQGGCALLHRAAGAPAGDAVRARGGRPRPAGCAGALAQGSRRRAWATTPSSSRRASSSSLPRLAMPRPAPRACETLGELAGRIVPPHTGAGEGGEAMPASGPQAGLRGRPAGRCRARACTRGRCLLGRKPAFGRTQPRGERPGADALAPGRPPEARQGGGEFLCPVAGQALGDGGGARRGRARRAGLACALAQGQAAASVSTLSSSRHASWSWPPSLTMWLRRAQAWPSCVPSVRAWWHRRLRRQPRSRV
jgi:CheY-like chemotaxis protein